MDHTTELPNRRMGKIPIRLKHKLNVQRLSVTSIVPLRYSPIFGTALAESRCY